MTSLDDARQIIEAGPLSWHTATKEWICGFCCERLFDPTTDDEADATIYESFTHDPDCPWLSMPRIVAALEAAGRLVEATQPTQYAIPARVICQICHSEGPDWSHTSTCTWAPAKAALEG